jgi:MYXO-CTERM domain-containing protein
MLRIALRLCGLRSLAALAVLALPACAPLEGPGDELDDEVTGEGRLTIKGGYEEPNYPSVVGIADFQHGSICTGSLIGPNLVLTARHCVSTTQNEAPGGGIICSQSTSAAPFNASAFAVTTKPDMYSSSYADWHDVAEVVTLPIDTNLFCGNDQAILILKENLAPEEAVPMIPRVDSMLAKGELYDAVGYGMINDTNQNSAGIRRRRDDLAVYCAETECVGVSAYVKDSEWIGDTGICSGDSGGPAIDKQGRVVGVTSRGGAGCVSPIYGSVHSWGQWIKDTALYAAQKGGYEAPLWAQGWPSDPAFNGPVGGDCVENGCSVCWDDACTRLCNETATCPSGYECKEVQEGTTLCTEKPKPKPSPDDDTEEETTSCSVGTPGAASDDPTNPVPWLVGALGTVLAAAGRRRRTPRA